MSVPASGALLSPSAAADAADAVEEQAQLAQLSEEEIERKRKNRLPKVRYVHIHIACRGLRGRLAAMLG
jgi:hypothetical protein